jgi:hypothetical protein
LTGPPYRDDAYSGRTETLPNTHNERNKAAGKPITRMTPIVGFIRQSPLNS